jgi:hypothetical protein
MTPNTPLFVKTHDFTIWLLQHSQRFPKNLRHSFTIRLENACFDFHQQLLRANAARGPVRAQRLDEADETLTWLRSLLRCAIDLKLLPSRQAEHAVRSVDELGRLLGAWKKKGTDR